MKAAEYYLNIATANGIFVVDEEIALEAIQYAIDEAIKEIQWHINNCG